MSSLQYTQVYSRLYTFVNMYDFLDLTDLQSNEFLCNWLHSAAANSRVRRLFSSFSLDDEIQTITFELKSPSDTTDDSMDIDIIIDILAKGMIVKWLTPKVLSLDNIYQTYGTTEMKYYSESAHLKEIKDLLNFITISQRQDISDRSASYNSYLVGEE